MIKYFLQASCRIYDVGIVNQEMKQSLACWLIVRSALIAIFVSIATCVFAVPVIIASLFQKNGNPAGNLFGRFMEASVGGSAISSINTDVSCLNHTVS